MLHRELQDRGWELVCSACRHNMEPNITLIWFVHPQWFQKMGAFSRRENLPVFVEWCETAFKLFGEAPALGDPYLCSCLALQQRRGHAVGSLSHRVNG